MRSIIFLLTFLLMTFSQATAGPGRVVFDQGHGQPFTIGKEGELQLGSLAGLFKGAGFEVAASTAPLTPQLLGEAKALVISGAFRPLSAEEIRAITGFLQQGGRLTVMLHIARPLIGLINELGVDAANGVVREGTRSLVLDDQPLNFHVRSLKEHPINNGLVSFSIYGGWPLLPLNDRAQVIASTSPDAWVDLDRNEELSVKDAVQEFAVVVAGHYGEGEFVVFGDDAIFQNRFLKGNNEKLAGNLVSWMMQGIVNR